MYPSPLHNEQELLTQLAAGDEQAFGTIYRHYIFSVSQFLVKYLKSPQIAEDISQEVFVKIWENRIRMSQVDSFKAYLFVTARNHSLNVLKSASRAAPVMGEIVRHYQLQRSDTEDELLNKEYLQFLQRTIADLPPRSREVFRLCREQGKSYDEVAALLGISRNSVKNHMVHSMKQLKIAVEKELGISFAIFLLLIARY